MKSLIRDLFGKSWPYLTILFLVIILLGQRADLKRRSSEIASLEKANTELQADRERLERGRDSISSIVTVIEVQDEEQSRRYQDRIQYLTSSLHLQQREIDRLLGSTTGDTVDCIDSAQQAVIVAMGNELESAKISLKNKDSIITLLKAKEVNFETEIRKCDQQVRNLEKINDLNTRAVSAAMDLAEAKWWQFVKKCRATRKLKKIYDTN